MSYKYSTTVGEKDAAAVGISLPISTKHTIEIAAFLRGKKLERAKTILGEVIKGKEAIPFKRFTNGVGHRRGSMASGRFPKKACGEILKIVSSAQANAQFKGLSSSDLVVRHISAQKCSNTYSYGRRRRLAKRTSVEVVLSEIAEKKEAPKAKPAANPKKQAKESQKAGSEQ